MIAATAEPAWYLTERAENLAVIYLTENPKIIITRQKQISPDLDILATLRESGQPGGRFFGVEVQAALSRTAEQRRKPLQTFQLPREKAAFFRDIPFPVCLFLFTVDDEQGYWGWIQQPIFDSKSGPRLGYHAQGELWKLTTEEINHIVSDVDRWYDARK